MVRKVIGLLGSPLTDGNTAKLLERALQGVRDARCDTETVVVANLDFQACMEMMFCKEHDTCIMDDDMQPMYGKFMSMDSLDSRYTCHDNGNSGQNEIFYGSFSSLFYGKICTQNSFFFKRSEKNAKGVVHLYRRNEHS